MLRCLGCNLMGDHGIGWERGQERVLCSRVYDLMMGK